MQQLSFFDVSRRSAPKAKPEIGSARSAPATLAASLPLFQSHLLTSGKSDHTLRAFASDMRLLARFLGEKTPLTHITSARLEHFLKYLRRGQDQGIPCNAKSLGRRITTLKAFFAWALVNGWITQDPALTIAYPEVDTLPPDILTEKELERLLAETARRRDESDDARPYLLVTLLITTGIKKKESLALKLSDLNVTSTGGDLYVRYSDARNRHKERRLRLPADFKATLALYRKRYLDPESRGPANRKQSAAKLFATTDRNLNYVLKEIGEAASISRTVTFEMLRSTCAVRDLRGGTAPDTLRLKLGVSEITWFEELPKLQLLATTAH